MGKQHHWLNYFKDRLEGVERLKNAAGLRGKIVEIQCFSCISPSLFVTKIHCVNTLLNMCCLKKGRVFRYAGNLLRTQLKDYLYSVYERKRSEDHEQCKSIST